ncbi:hypothetical protein [Hymenobacter psoromatis]|uniref:hypothetical protein n=1 Tax=Hymenobacter psoromatis TaxID=1484116 RepID=UPI001CC005F7|nr:hypothetical protein [Hymenobacter psoromatis]
MTHKEKWLLLAPVGLLGIGAGACLVGWAAELKTRKEPAAWVPAGTAALVVLNAGVSLLGQSIIEKVLHELHEKPTNEAFSNL